MHMWEFVTAAGVIVERTVASIASLKTYIYVTEFVTHAYVGVRDSCWRHCGAHCSLHCVP